MDNPYADTTVRRKSANSSLLLGFFSAAFLPNQGMAENFWLLGAGKMTAVGTVASGQFIQHSQRLGTMGSEPSNLSGLLQLIGTH